MKEMVKKIGINEFQMTVLTKGTSDTGYGSVTLACVPSVTSKKAPVIVGMHEIE